MYSFQRDEQSGAKSQNQAEQPSKVSDYATNPIQWQDKQEPKLQNEQLTTDS